MNKRCILLMGDIRIHLEVHTVYIDEFPITEPQQKMIVAIRKLTQANFGQPPSIRELMDETGITSPNGVICHLEPLVKKGVLTWKPNTARSIRLLEEKMCPHCGGAL